MKKKINLLLTQLITDINSHLDIDSKDERWVNACDKLFLSCKSTIRNNWGKEEEEDFEVDILPGFIVMNNDDDQLAHNIEQYIKSCETCVSKLEYYQNLKDAIGLDDSSNSKEKKSAIQNESNKFLYSPLVRVGQEACPPDAFFGIFRLGAPLFLLCFL